MAALTLMAKGNFASHIVDHMEYPAEWYSNFEQGEDVITSVLKTPTRNASEELCKALGIQLTNLRTHTNIDVSLIPKQELLKSKVSADECHSFYALRKAGFRFFAVLEM